MKLTGAAILLLNLIHHIDHVNAGGDPTIIDKYIYGMFLPMHSPIHHVLCLIKTHTIGSLMD